MFNLLQSNFFVQYSTISHQNVKSFRQKFVKAFFFLPVVFHKEVSEPGYIFNSHVFLQSFYFPSRERDIVVDFGF